MSSVYPPYGSMQTLPCQRCNTPLFPNEPTCKNCGYYNAPVQGNNPAQGVPPSSNTARGGLLSSTAYGQGQYNGAPQGQPPTPFAPNTPMTPPSVQYPYGGSTPGSMGQFGAFRTGPVGSPSPAASPPGSQYGATPSGPITGQPSFGPPPSSPNQPGMYARSGAASPQTRDFKKASTEKRRSKVWLIAGVVIALIVIGGGSFAGYTFLIKPRTAQVTPAVPVLQPKGTPVFTDTFKNNDHAWNLQAYPGKFAVALDAGSLVLEDNNNELLWELVPGGKTFGDFTLSVDAMLSKGEQNNGYGIYIRGSSLQNTDLATYYRFELYGDGSYAIFKGNVDANGNPSSSKLVDYTLHPTIQKQGGLNHVLIAAKGSSMSLVVNGQHLKTITDSNYASGSIAFFVSNLQNVKPGAQAKFSNLNIYAA